LTGPDGREPEPAGPPPTEGRGSEPAPGTASAGAAPRRLRGGVRRRAGGTLAFVESPVQLLNVLEWAHQDSTSTTVSSAGAGHGATEGNRHGGTDTSGGTDTYGRADNSAGAAQELTIVVLSPHDPMTRGQLRRVAELARDEGIAVRWEEARGGVTAPLKTVGSLAGDLRRARRVVIGDPFSRYVQLLLTLTAARSVVVVDDGTATMEFVSQLARGERLVRWHRKGSGGVQAALFAPFARRARSRLTPGASGASSASGGSGAGRGREARSRVEIFSSMPVDASAGQLRELGVTVTANEFAWTRARFGPPRLTRGTDLVGTSLVETGVVDLERYLEAVGSLARTHGATRYFAHRRESSDKLQKVTAATGLEIVRPDLPLELVARRGPIGRTILSFPSTVVHTLPLALAGTPVSVAVCEVERTWLTSGASPRAEGFLSGVTGTARNVRRLGAGPAQADVGQDAGQDSGPADAPSGAAPATETNGTSGTTATADSAGTTGASRPEETPSRPPISPKAGRASA
jgi:hypothetical protein